MGIKRSAKGKLVNTDDLKNKSGTIKAVSNVNINSNGDYLDKNGKIIKSRDKIVSDYKKANSNSTVKHVSLKQTTAEEFANLITNTEFKTAEEAVSEIKGRKRKLVKDENDGSE